MRCHTTRLDRRLGRCSTLPSPQAARVRPNGMRTRGTWAGPSRAKDYATHVVSGLSNVPKGGLQASKLRILSIHRSYLLLMLAADASEEYGMDFWQQDLTPIRKEQILGALEQLRLDERVGVMLTIVTREYTVIGTHPEPPRPVDQERHDVGASVASAAPTVCPRP